MIRRFNFWPTPEMRPRGRTGSDPKQIIPKCLIVGPTGRRARNNRGVVIGGLRATGRLTAAKTREGEERSIALFDGYYIAERLLEGVLFEVRPGSQLCLRGHKMPSIWRILMKSGGTKRLARQLRRTQMSLALTAAKCSRSVRRHTLRGPLGLSAYR